MSGTGLAYASRIKAKRAASRWPCIKCKKQCVTDAIFCENCCEWAHYVCENICVDEFKELSNVSCAYVCSRCRVGQRGHFDFEKSLERLSNASRTIVALQKAAILEKILLKNHQFHLPEEEPSSTAQRTIHHYSQLVVNFCGGIPSRVPIHVKGDGNCLFNAVSVAIQGNEAMSCELRVRTCLELVLNFEHYKAHRNYENFRLVSPDLVEACQKSAQDGTYSSMFTIQGLSSVIGQAIVSVYPAMNGMLDKCVPILNTVITPRVPLAGNQSRGKVYVLWSRMVGTCPHPRDQIWLPNHFVPLIEKNRSTSDVKTSSPVSVSSPSPRFVVSPLKTTPSKIRDSKKEQDATMVEDHLHPNIPPSSASSRNQTRLSPPDSYVSSSDEEATKGATHEVPEQLDKSMSNSYIWREDSNSDINPACSMYNCAEELNSTPESSNSKVNGHSIEHSNSMSSCSGQYNNCPPRKNRLNGRFLDVESLCDQLQNGTDVKCSIPKGLKENVFFLIGNESNFEKRRRGKRSNFDDDCGAWQSKSSSTKKTLFHHLNDKFKAIEVKNGKYCTLKMKEWVPLEPQPQDEEIVIMRRFYATLKRKSDYKKRVTWIEKSSSKMNIACQGKAIVEFLGTFPSHSAMHGNSKKGAGSEYVRTSEAIKAKIKDKITSAPPRNVYTDLVLENSLDAPRNLKQVQNIKHAHERENRGTQNRKNTADDIQTIINMMNEHPFIQEIVQTKGKPPMVILYNEEQLKEVRKFCVTKTNKSILGVDRTFNLGPCFVTLTVFKNSHLLRRSTQASPIMLGPLFLHWDGECSTYQRFFSHLRTKLDASISTEIGLCDVIVGSDEEKAILKAVQQSFPSATQILCQRHLEENVRRHLQHTVGTPDKIRNEVVSLIFGGNGLVHARDSVEFELQVLSLSNTFLDMVPNFVPYFDNSLVPRIREFVYEPKITSKWIPLNWNNNNCESLNNILKLSTNWKALKLPDLIEKIYSIVKLQYADMRRALHGHGNYQVIPQLKSFVLSHTVWSQKTEEEKVRHFQKFISVSTLRNKNVLTSTDGALHIPKTPLIAKKPGQRKRVRNAKTQHYRKRIKVEEP